MLVGQRRTDRPATCGRSSATSPGAPATAIAGDDRRLVRPPVRLLSVVVRRRVGSRGSATPTSCSSTTRTASYFSHTALPFLSRLRPVVWRLSDMWAFTGHVAYSYDCERWRHGCGSCPYLGEYPALSRDTTAALWRWKNAVYKRSKLTIVAPSRWIERLASREPAALALPDRAHPERDRPRALPPRRRARRRARGSGCRRRARSCCSARRTSPTGARAARSSTPRSSG